MNKPHRNKQLCFACCISTDYTLITVYSIYISPNVFISSDFLKIHLSSKARESAVLCHVKYNNSEESGTLKLLPIYWSAI